MSARTTNFRITVQERHWTFEGFCIPSQRACEEVAEHDRDPRLATVPIPRRTFDQGRPELEQALFLGTQALHTSGSAPILSVWQRATELLQYTGKWQAEPVVRDYASELAALNYRPAVQVASDERP